jgi:hypothetical protein
VSRARKEKRDRVLAEALALVQAHSRNKAKEVVAGFVLDFIAAAIPAVLPVPAKWRWGIWFLSFAAFLCLLQIQIPALRRIQLKWRIVATFVLVCIFVGSFWPTAYAQWREEQAAALEGDLIGAGAAINDGKPHGFPLLQMGESVIVMTPVGVADIMPFFPDAGIRIEWGLKSLPLLTTTVRDYNGNLVAEVVRNHWRVYPTYCADKNYTEDALEVKDTAGHVVLQVRILKDRVLLLGEWWDNQGNGVRLMRPLVTTPTKGSGIVRMNRQNQFLNELVQPIFKYPSKDHWGEMTGTWPLPR